MFSLTAPAVGESPDQWESWEITQRQWGVTLILVCRSSVPNRSTRIVLFIKLYFLCRDSDIYNIRCCLSPSLKNKHLSRPFSGSVVFQIWLCESQGAKKEKKKTDFGICENDKEDKSQKEGGAEGKSRKLAKSLRLTDKRPWQGQNLLHVTSKVWNPDLYFWDLKNNRIK